MAGRCGCPGRLGCREAGVHLPQIDLAGEGLTAARLLRVVQASSRLRVRRGVGQRPLPVRAALAGTGLVALVAGLVHGGMDLVTSVALPSLRGPLPLASALLALARLSDGVGRGWARAPPAPTTSWQVSRSRIAGQRSDRSVEALRSLLREGCPPTRRASGWHRTPTSPAGGELGLGGGVAAGGAAGGRAGWPRRQHRSGPFRRRTGRHRGRADSARAPAGGSPLDVGHDVDVGDPERSRRGPGSRRRAGSDDRQVPGAPAGPSVHRFREAVCRAAVAVRRGRLPTGVLLADR